MATRTPVGRLGAAGLGVVLLAGLIGLLVVWLGVEATVDVLQMGVLSVAYVAVPIVLLAALLGVYFKLNAWRQ
jgi:apolipoprotein N-acyltransferase